MKLTKLLVIGFIGVISCTDAKTEKDDTAPKTVVKAEEKPDKIISINDTPNRTTLEGFYNILKTAIITRDLETLETLFAPETSSYKFDDPEEQSLVKATQFSDVKLSASKNGEKELYELFLVFPISKEEIEEGLEASATSIYMQKNDKGEYEIFIISFAG